MVTIPAFPEVGIIFGVISIVMLVASELLSAYREPSDLVKEKRMVKIISLFFGHAFLAIILVSVVQMILDF